MNYVLLTHCVLLCTQCVNRWNNLPKIVVHAPSVCSLESRLDELCAIKLAKHNYEFIIEVILVTKDFNSLSSECLYVSMSPCNTK